MKQIFVFYLILFFAENSFAQKTEIIRFLITDSEKTDSAFIKTIIQRIYIAARQEKIQAFNDSHLIDSLNISELENIGEFCETVQMSPKLTDCPLIDTIICTPADYYNIYRFSIQNKELNTFPFSISVDLGLENNEGIKNPLFWIDFLDLPKILTRKQISYILESTNILPLAPEY